MVGSHSKNFNVFVFGAPYCLGITKVDIKLRIRQGDPFGWKIRGIDGLVKIIVEIRQLIYQNILECQLKTAWE